MISTRCKFILGGSAVLLVCGLATLKLVSEPRTEKITPEQAVILTFNDVETVPEGVLIKNRRHEAFFSDRGLRFTPRRGPTWQWQLDYIGPDDPENNGARHSAVSSIAPVQPVRSAVGHIDYGRDRIVERYVLKRRSLEQQFVIPQPPALGAEDLRITGRIRTTGRLESTERGWLWRDSEGVVSLGRVRVYDATGAVLPARMAVTPDRIGDRTDIWVDGRALAQARYPVTIDPEIGTNDFRISNVGTDNDTARSAADPAVAYNPAANEYLVVWVGDDLATDNENEIFGQRLNAGTGDELGSDFRISNMVDVANTRRASSPAVAYNPAANQYLVVWRGDGLATVGEFEVFGQRLNAGTGEDLGNDFRISNMVAVANTRDASSPAVAYNPAANEYLVVWSGDGLPTDNEFEIFGQRLNASTGDDFGSDFRISNVGPDTDPFRAASSPAVAYNPAANEYLVVWRGDGLTDDEFEVFGQRVNAGTGVELGIDFRISNMADVTNARDAGSPAVAYNPAANQYLVVWEGDGLGTADDEFEIFGQRVNAGTGVELGSDFRISNVGTDTDPDRDAHSPAVAYNPAANEYLVVWFGDGLADEKSEIFGQRLNAGTGVEIGIDFRISNMVDVGDTRDALSPAVAYNPAANEYLAVWDGDGLPTDDEFEIFGQRLSFFCGDGAVDPGEEDCDDGGESAVCDTDCTAAECGDGTMNTTAGEGCDDGAANSNTEADACRMDCVAAFCGDGVTDTGEGCDDGNADNSDACLNTCVSATCGDGMIQTNVEECDDGAANSDTEADACRTNCTDPRCGDGVVDTGEECDDGGASAACNADCTAVVKGDGGGCSLSPQISKGF